MYFVFDSKSLFTKYKSFLILIASESLTKGDTDDLCNR